MLSDPNYNTYENFISDATNKKCIVLGAGSRSDDMIKALEGEVDIAYIIDSDYAKWGKTAAGIEICAPERLKEENPEECVILSCLIDVWDAERYAHELGVKKFYAYQLFFEWQIDSFTVFDATIPLNDYS